MEKRRDFDRISRRDFIRGAVGAGLALGVGYNLFLSEVFGASKSEGFDIAVAQGSPERAVRAALDILGGMGRFVKKGSSVVIKPNMSFPTPASWGATTNPIVVAEVSKLCLEAGAKRVLVLDHPLRQHELSLKRSGIQEACKGIKGTYVFAMVEDKFYQRVEVPKGKELKSVEVMKDVLKADVLISVPTAKSHNATGVSLGLKGMMGLIWNREYFHEKVDLNQAIADLNTLLKADLTVIDGTRALTTSGPSGPGEVVQLNTIIAGSDPVAMDSYAVSLAKWYGRSFKGRNVKHILQAYEMGLGEVDTDKLKIKKVSV